MLQGRRGREEEKKRKAKEEKKRVAQEKKKKKEKAGFAEIESSKRKALKMQAEAKQKEATRRGSTY